MEELTHPLTTHPLTTATERSIMETPLIITKVEIDELLKLLPSDEAQRTLSFIDALKVFDRAAAYALKHFKPSERARADYYHCKHRGDELSAGKIKSSLFLFFICPSFVL